MHVQADDFDVWVADDALGNFQNGVNVQAELDALDAGIGFGVRLRRQVGIDAQSDQGGAVHRSSYTGQGVQLLLALDVEHQDVALQAVAVFGLGLAGAGEDDLGTGAAGLEGAEQLAVTGHVRSRHRVRP